MILSDCPDLPNFKIKICYGFKFTGLDYVGPFCIKTIVLKKAYLLLFTLASSCVTYLESVPGVNLTFLLVPSYVYSKLRY